MHAKSVAPVHAFAFFQVVSFFRLEAMISIHTPELVMTKIDPQSISIIAI
jgi:hypothetical protein